MKAIGHYILIEALQSKHKEVNGLLLTEKTDVDNKLFRGKIYQKENLLRF